MALVYFRALLATAQDRENCIMVTTYWAKDPIYKNSYKLEKPSELQALYNKFVSEVMEQGGKCFYVVVRLEEYTKMRGFKQAVERLGDRQIISPDYF